MKNINSIIWILIDCVLVVHMCWISVIVSAFACSHLHSTLVNNGEKEKKNNKENCLYKRIASSVWVFSSTKVSRTNSRHCCSCPVSISLFSKFRFLISILSWIFVKDFLQSFVFLRKMAPVPLNRKLLIHKRKLYDWKSYNMHMCVCVCLVKNVCSAIKSG